MNRRAASTSARARKSTVSCGPRGQGLALLVVSSDLPEVLALADRIVVMADGRTVGELDGATATRKSAAARHPIHASFRAEAA